MRTSIDDQITELFTFDMAAEVARICDWMRDQLRSALRRRGLVIGISGGVDSAVCTALAARAVGPEKVFGLLMPERDSSSESAVKGRLVAERYGVPHGLEDIAPTLEAIGCYRWRDEAMHRANPSYRPGWKNKIVIGGGSTGGINFFKLVVESPDGSLQETRLGLSEYLQIVAATNFKQRVRKTLEFFHADRLNYAVIGTPNRLEYDQGFFVKNGDGSADLKPIAHLYKSQVYMLAEYLDVPLSVRTASPSTDTYSLSQGQEEFYFALPYKEMDVALFLRNSGAPSAELASRLGISAEQAALVYQDIDAKRRTTAPLHWSALTLEKVLNSASVPT